MLPFDEAVERIREALKQDPENAEMWCSWGIALMELKRYEEAAGKFEKAAELKAHNKRAVRMRYSTEMIRRKFELFIKVLREL